MYPIFFTFVVFALFTYVFMRRSNVSISQQREEFMEREREANSVRKQPLTDLKYINLDLSSLPVIETDDEYITERLRTLSVLAEPDNKIVNLSGVSNTDLKLKYGVANLTILTAYDQNFTNLCRCLFELGRRLYEAGDSENAIKFLEYGLNCGTDLKSHYTLMADIYEQNMQYKDIVKLIQNVENVNPTLRGSLVSDLNRRLEGTNYSASEPVAPLENINTSGDE